MKSPHVLVVLFLLFFEACSKPADKPRCRQQVLLNSRPGGNGPGTTNPGIINSGAVNLGISSSGTPSPTAPSPGTPSPSTANSNGTNPGASKWETVLLHKMGIDQCCAQTQEYRPQSLVVTQGHVLASKTLFSILLLPKTRDSLVSHGPA